MFFEVSRRFFYTILALMDDDFVLSYGFDGLFDFLGEEPYGVVTFRKDHLGLPTLDATFENGDPDMDIVHVKRVQKPTGLLRNLHAVFHVYRFDVCQTKRDAPGSPDAPQ
jgi:hypothetical protein